MKLFLLVLIGALTLGSCAAWLTFKWALACSLSPALAGGLCALVGAAVLIGSIAMAMEDA